VARSPAGARRVLLTHTQPAQVRQTWRPVLWCAEVTEVVKIRSSGSSQLVLSGGFRAGGTIVAGSSRLVPAWATHSLQ
jgi:hypothetical protein